jgi:hypothetical protein
MSRSSFIHSVDEFTVNGKTNGIDRTDRTDDR